MTTPSSLRGASRSGWRAWLALPLATTGLLALQVAIAPSASAGVQYLGQALTNDAGGLGDPQGLGTDPDGNVYVADSAKYRIVVFRADGGYSTAFGRGSPQAAGTDGHVYYPSDVAWFGGDVFVADTGGPDVQEFTDHGQFVRRWGNPTGAAPATGQFAYPDGITADCEGHIFVTDGRRHDIQEFNKDGSFIREFGVGKVDVPVGIAAASVTATECVDTDIFVADEHANRLEHFSPDGTFVGYIGGPGTDPGQYGGPEQVALQRNPDTTNLELWVAEAGNSRVQELVSSDQGATWQPKLMIMSGAAKLNAPHGVAVARNGQIIVSSMGSGAVYWYAQEPPRLRVRHARTMDSHDIKSSKGFFVHLNYNQLDQSCKVAVKVKVTVPPNALHVFTLQGSGQAAADDFDGVGLDLSDRQLGWMEHAWHNGHKVAFAAKGASTTCTDGAQVRGSDDWKIGP